MNKPHRNRLENARIRNLLTTFSKIKKIDFSEIEPMSLIEHHEEGRRTYVVNIGENRVITTNDGIEIDNLEALLEDIVKAAFITGVFIDNTATTNRNFEYIRRNAHDEENRIMLLYKFGEIEFYFMINVMGNSATVTAEIKGEENFDIEVEAIINNHINLIAPRIINGLLEFENA